MTEVPIFIVNGLIESGKTTLIKEIIENNISYVTFIDERQNDKCKCKCKCKIKMKTHYVGEIIGRLSDALTFYFIETLN